MNRFLFRLDIVVSLQARLNIEGLLSFGSTRQKIEIEVLLINVSKLNLFHDKDKGFLQASEAKKAGND